MKNLILTLFSLVLLTSCEEEAWVTASDLFRIDAPEHIINKTDLDPSGIDIAYVNIYYNWGIDPNCYSATIEVDITKTTLKEGVDFSIPEKTVTFTSKEISEKSLAIEFNATTITEPQQIALHLHYNDSKFCPIKGRYLNHAIVNLVPKTEE